MSTAAAKRKEKRELAKSVQVKQKQNAWTELQKEFQSSAQIRCANNGPDDELLINAVTLGTFTDVKNILISKDETCSQEALDISLLTAAKTGQKLTMTLLLKSGARTTECDDEGNTALMICSQKGYIDMVKILIYNKCDKNASNNAGDTALSLAVNKSGSAEMTRLLVSTTNVNLKNSEGSTALLKAIQVGDLETIRLLIMSGANIADTLNGETVLDLANKNGLLSFVQLFSKCQLFRLPSLIAAVTTRDIEIVSTILTCEQSCINQRDSDDKSALETLFSCIISQRTTMPFSSSDKQIIKILICRGIDVNKPTFKKSKGKKRYLSNDSPLVKACQIGDLDVIKWLCIKGANVNESVNYNQFTPLMMAAREGCLDIVLYLLSKQADAQVKGKEGTALDIAVKYGHIECAKRLLEEKAAQGVAESCKIAIEYKSIYLLKHIVEKFNIDLKTMVTMEMAIESGSKDIMQYFVDNGFEVNKSFVFFDGYTSSYNRREIYPISLCVKRGNYDLVQLLIQHKADVNVRDSNGQTVIFDACVSPNKDILNLLLLSGVNVNVVNTSGRSAIFCAVESRLKENVRMLLSYGAVVNTHNSYKETPLSIAIEHQDSRL